MLKLLGCKFFSNCVNLNNIIFEEISTLEDLEFGVFSNCNSLEKNKFTKFN